MKNDNPNMKKNQRPPRAKLTKEEVIERMRKFPERKERFLPTGQENK